MENHDRHFDQVIKFTITAIRYISITWCDEKGMHTYIRGERLLTSVAHLPHIYSLDLIVRNHQTNSDQGTSNRMPDQCTLEVSRSWDTRKTGSHTEVGVTWEDVTPKARWGPGLHPEQKKNLDKGHSFINIVVLMLISLHLMIILWMQT